MQVGVRYTQTRTPDNRVSLGDVNGDQTMSDDKKVELSRRNVLASLGAIGAASAAAGAGTMAYFNDEETFQNNQLTAGSLDLKVDWQQSYNGNPVGAFPDENSDNVQDEIRTRDEIAQERHNENYDTLSEQNQQEVEQAFRAQFADVPDDTDAPLINLDDVKPGDWGEVTFSTHLFDNPGYLWMNGELKANAENGMTEPEADATDPNANAGDLADAIETTIWYDEDCDNEVDQTTKSKPVCVELVLDASGSMGNPSSKNENTIKGAKSLAERVLNANANNRVGVTFFSAAGYDESAKVQLSAGASGASDLNTVQSTIDTLPASGDSTAIGAGIDTGQSDLQNCPTGHDRVMVVLTNGEENVQTDQEVVNIAANAKGAGTRIITIGVGASPNTQLLKDVASDPDSENAFTGTDPSNIQDVFNTISGTILQGEEIIFEGSLADALDLLSQDHGIPLDGDLSTAYAEVEDTDGDGVPDKTRPGQLDSRNPFPNSSTHCIGFKWHLPASVGNEAQTDSVTFNLGFYAEQARHNSGAGM